MDCVEVPESLYHNGYAMLPDLLSPLQISEMKAFLTKENVVLRNGARVRADQIPAGATLLGSPFGSLGEHKRGLPLEAL
jgi:hypothetical protein